jgi:uncharacterized coiled-coil DUF342 family protein
MNLTQEISLSFASHHPDILKEIILQFESEASPVLLQLVSPTTLEESISLMNSPNLLFFHDQFKVAKHTISSKILSLDPSCFSEIPLCNLNEIFSSEGFNSEKEELLFDFVIGMIELNPDNKSLVKHIDLNKIDQNRLRNLLEIIPLEQADSEILSRFTEIILFSCQHNHDHFQDRSKLTHELSILSQKCDQLSKEQSQHILKLDQISHERDHLSQKCDILSFEVQQLSIGRDQLTQENNRLLQQYDQLTLERDQNFQQRNQLSQKCDTLSFEVQQLSIARDQLIIENNRLFQQCDQLTLERDQISQQRNQLSQKTEQNLFECEQFKRELNQLRTTNHSLQDENRHLQQETNQKCQTRTSNFSNFKMNSTIDFKKFFLFILS